MMKYDFTTLVDIAKLQELTDELYAATSIPSSIITAGGDILTESGWQKICTDFHRAHPDIEKECIASDRAILRKVQDGAAYVVYRCPHGLIDASAPIIIDGSHVASVFTGQVFLEPPDEKTELFFRAQARKFGFDEAAYIRAFKDVPVFTEEKFRRALSFVAKLAQMIADMGHLRHSELETMTALRESKEQFQTLVEKSPLGIALIGKDGRYKYTNTQFFNMFGYTADDVPSGAEWFKRAFPDRAYRQRAIRTWIADQRHAAVGQSRPRVFTVTCSDGSRKDIHFRPVTLQSLEQFVIYEDRTEKIRLERQLQQTQKFEAIGTLAGGIAHDFNNLLMGIQGRASLMMLGADASHADVEHIQAIEEYIRSAADLTKQLLGLARGGKYEVRAVDLDALVMESAAMFGRARKEIRIHTKPASPAPVVEVDKRQIEQVLLNIYINAWQAMPGGGDLFIETRVVSLDDIYCRSYRTTEGEYARIAVTDTGIGMDEATRLRIFDPFFTTKEKGRGTGLGLASAYGIIKNHGGMITVYSEPGNGSTFNIYLPISQKVIQDERLERKGLVKGTETILVVDDEEMIIDVAKAMLERLGYRPITAKSGQEAVDAVTVKGEAVDLVILDLIMPGMDGAKTFDRLRTIRPEIPVMLSSGYTVSGQAEAVLKKGCNGFIQKPFGIAELSIQVRQILDAAKSARGE